MVKSSFSFLIIALIFIISPHALADSGKLAVVATLFPTYDFVNEIGGELVEATLLLPPGVESHSFSPTPRDMLTINKAKVFVFTGQAMEPWAHGLLAGVDNKELMVVNSSKGVTSADGEHHQHGKHTDSDPHIWLDPLKAMVMAETIGHALGKVDPENERVYVEQTKKYIAKLRELDMDIRLALSQCQLDTIISGGHFAFGNFAKRYNISAVSAYNGFSPDARPSPKGITRLITTMKRVGSKVVFHEELIDPKIARIIAEETGAELRLLHGAHNISRKEMQNGATYLSIMRDNLAHLQEALQCQ